MSDMIALLNDLSYIPPNNEQNEPIQEDIGETSNEPTQAKRNEFAKSICSVPTRSYTPVVLWALKGVRGNIDVATWQKFNMGAMVYRPSMIFLLEVVCLGGVGKQYLPDEVAKPIIELCSFFKQICSATLMEDDMLKAQSKVVDILCNLELIYPPAFFDIMIHLVIHLPLEALERRHIRIPGGYGQLTEVDAPPDIIDLDEDDDIIDDEDALPHDLADFDDEDLVNVDDDDGGELFILVEIEIDLEFETCNKTLIYFNDMNEIVIGFGVAFVSTHLEAEGLAERKLVAIVTKYLGLQNPVQLDTHMQIQCWADINAGIQQHLQKASNNTNKLFYKAAHWCYNTGPGLMMGDDQTGIPESITRS
ncbi:RNA-directed DNA polymerase, eukaryota [Tanacetum coccineum]